MRASLRWPSGSYPLRFAFLAIYLLIFFVLPVGTMIIQGLSNDEGRFVADNLRALIDNPLYLESLRNSLCVASGAALLAAAAALPVAMLLWRYHVRPPVFIELCGFLPLFVPPFVLAVSLQTFLGRGGALGLLLESCGDFDPALGGLTSVMIVEALHYFPLVLTALIMTTSAYSQQAAEAARLGSDWWRLLTRVFLPLGMPGLAFGMAITFLKTMDDLATPLSLGVTNLLSTQVFFRISTHGAQDPLSSLMAVAMVVVSGLVWFASISLVRQQVAWRKPASVSDSALTSGPQRWVGVAVLGAILILYACSYAGVFLASIARIWSYTVVPESFVLTHYLTIIDGEMGSFGNTLAYCGFAAVLDVVVGLVVAYAIDQASPVWKRWLTWGAAGLLSVPGVALAIAYLQFFRGIELPFLHQPLDATWILLPMAFSVRGLPFAIRACSLALHSVPASYVEAASLSGASRFGVFSKVVLPMMATGVFVAFVLCFGVAAVDLSSAMLLFPSETDAPVSYSIYLHMQSTRGRGTGAALAILSIGLVSLSLFAIVVLIRRYWKTESSFRKFVFAGSQRSRDLK